MDRPALIMMITRANFQRSGDILRILGSNKLRACGPSTIPVSIMPIIAGTLIALQAAPIAKPKRKISASEVSIYPKISEVNVHLKKFYSLPYFFFAKRPIFESYILAA